MVNFQAAKRLTCVLCALADVVDVDKPGFFSRLGDATTLAYDTIQVVVGDAQYEYDYAKCKYWDSRDCRCAAMVRSGSACAG